MSRLQTNHDAAGSSGLALESRATRFAIVAFVLTGVVTIFVFHGTHAPLAGEGSVGALAAWAAGGFAAVAFATSFTIEVRRGHAAWRARLPLVKRLIDVFGMSMAMGILAYLIVTAVAQLFQQGFLGMTVDAYGGGVLSGAAAAALVYAASLAGARVTSEGLAMLATLVLFACIGVLLAIVGLVPDAVNFAVHVGSASGMVVLFVVYATVALRRLPGVPKDFGGFTVGIVVGIAVSILLWIPIGYYKLTGMEFIAAGLLFAWLMVFVRMATVYGGERLSENRLAVAGGADVSSSGFEGGSCVRLDA